MGLLSRDQGSFGATISSPAEPERQHQQRPRRAGQTIGTRKPWTSRRAPFSRISDWAYRPSCSWRAWKSCWAFRARRPFEKHAWLNDRRLPLLPFFASRSSDPFINGILVCRHSGSNIRRVSSVKVTVVVSFLILGDREVFVRIAFTFTYSSCAISFIVGDNCAGGNFCLNATFWELIEIVKVFVGEIFIWEWRIVLIYNGPIVVFIYQQIILFLGSLLLCLHHHQWGCGWRGEALSGFSHLPGYLISFHRLGSGWGGFDRIIEVLIIGVFIIVSFSFTFQVPVPIWVVFIGVRVLGVRHIRHRCVTVRAVVLTVIVGRLMVRHNEQLLDVALKYFLVQDPCSKDNDTININDGVVAPVQGLRDLFFTIQNQSDILLVDTESDPMPFAVREVDAPEKRIVLWARLLHVILIQENRGSAQLHPNLLDALLIVNGDQERLASLLGFHRG